MKFALAVLLVIGIGFEPAALTEELHPLEVKLSEITGVPEHQVLEAVFGEVQFEFVETDYNGYSCWSTLKCYGAFNPLDDPRAKGLLIHELGHRFLNSQGLTFDELNLNIGYYENGKYVHVTGINPQTGQYLRTAKGYVADERPCVQHSPSVPGTGQTYQEDFADMFMAWTLDGFTDDEAGRLRYEWMDNFVRRALGGRIAGYDPGVSHNKTMKTNSGNLNRRKENSVMDVINQKDQEALSQDLEQYPIAAAAFLQTIADNLQPIYDNVGDALSKWAVSIRREALKAKLQRLGFGIKTAAWLSDSWPVRLLPSVEASVDYMLFESED